MSTIAERTFVISTQAIGTVEVTATLETANASLASYITESRTYLDGVRTSIDSDLATLTAEAATERSSAYNKDFGTAAGTVAEGNHLHDDRYFSKNDINSLLELYEPTFSKRSGFNLPVGSVAGTLASGVDPRFSDAREPLAHTHTKVQIVDLDESDYATAAQGLLADSAMQPEDAEELYHSRSEVNILLGQLEPRFTKNTGFNLQLGTTLGTVAEGQHTHTHFPNAVTVSETTHASSPLNTLTSKNYVDEKVRQLLESEGFVFKHNEMLLLDGDDHLQYHTDARGDARYPSITSTNANFISVNSRIDAQNPRFDSFQSDLNQAYVDINQERTDRTYAEFVLRQELEENIQDVDDAAVHILGDQVIDGEKKFTGNVIVEGEAILQNVTIKSQSELDVGDAIVLLNAGETGTPSVDAGFEIERGTQANAQLLFDESTDQWVAGIVGALKALASENYVDDNFVGLTGDQTIAGEKTFDNAIFANTIVPKDAPNLFTNAPWQYASALRYTDFPVNQLPNVQYVKDNFLSLDGGTILGSAPALNLTSTEEAGTTYLTFNNGDGETSRITGIDNQLRLEYTNGARLTLTSTAATFTKEARGPDPVDNTAYTPKKYVEDHFLSTTDTDVQSVAGAVVFAEYLTAQGVLQVNDWLQSSFEAVRFAKPARALNSQTGTPNNLDYLTKEFVDDNFLSLNGGTLTDDLEIEATSGDSKIRLKDDDGSYFDLVSSSGVTSLERFNTGNTKTNQLRINDTYTLTSQELRGPDPSTDTGYTPRQYVEEHFLSLDGGTLSGDLTVQDADPVIKINTTDTSKASRFEMRVNDALRGTIFTEASGAQRTFIEKRGGSVVQNQIVLDNDKTSFSTDVNLIGGELNIDNAGSFSNRITVNATNTGLAQYRMNQDNKIIGLLYSQNSTVFLRQYNDPDNFGVGSQLAFTDGNVTATHGDLRSNNMGSIGTSVTTKSYVENNFVTIDTTQNIDGDKKFTKGLTVEETDGISSINIKAPGVSDSSYLDYYINNKRSALIFRTGAGTGATDAGTLRIRRYNTIDNTVSSELVFGGSSISSNNSFNVNGNLTVNTTESSNALWLANNGVNEGLFQTTDSGRLYIRKYNGGNIANEIEMKDDGLISITAQEVRGPDPISATGFVTRQYAGNNYLGIDSSTGYVLNSISVSGSSVPEIRLRKSGINSGGFFATTNSFIIRRSNSSGNTVNELQMNDTFTEATKEVRGPDPSTTTAYVNRQYAENNFARLNDVDTTGFFRLKADYASIIADAQISNGQASLTLRIQNKRRGLCYTQADSTRLRHYESDGATVSGEFVLYEGNGAAHSGYIQSSVEMRGPSTHSTNSNAKSLVTKDYIDDVYTPASSSASGSLFLREIENNGTSAVILSAPGSIASGYVVQLPNTIGAVGDRLECVSVSGATMVMDWVSA